MRSCLSPTMRSIALGLKRLVWQPASLTADSAPSATGPTNPTSLSHTSQNSQKSLHDEHLAGPSSLPGLRCSATQGANRLRVVWLAKNRRAGNEDICPSVAHRPGIRGIDAAIDFNSHVQTPLGNLLFQGTDLVQGGWNKTLAKIRALKQQITKRS